MPRFQAPREAVIPSLRSTERRLAKDPEKAAAYRIEMEKLAQAGSIKKLGPDTPTQESESWYIPHHMPVLRDLALQRHVAENSEPGEDVRVSVERCFYVDNCLQSLPSPAEARQLVDKLRNILKSGGFELRQWASNDQSVVSHLPKEARSDSLELWITQEKEEQPESTLGLSWHCPTDTLGYKHRAVKYGTPTMRNIYKVLASQYDPLGFILPYTTRAKVLVQRLWDKRRDWDDPLLPLDLLQAWNSWEEELQSLPSINLPRCYEPKQVDRSNVIREVHVFCDASEKAYGSVAYMRTEDSNGKLHLSFIMARSRVAPKQLHSMPRLELCAAVTGAQLAKLLEKELTLKIDKTTLWTDSTTVLTWLQSESCRFKVFVGTRVAEIQELTNCQAWRYVDSARNPADDITRGKTLQDLAKPNRWSQGPPFLLRDLEQWPVMPHTGTEEDTAELRKSAFCGHTSVSPNPQGSDEIQCTTWKELLEVTTRELHGAASQGGDPKAEDYREAEAHIFRRIQQECFPDELRLLKAGKAVGTSSRLLTLAPELDDTGELIRVGGRLRRAENLDYATAHPIVLDPTHHFTRLLIKDYDSRLCHPGPERVFAEMRRTFWILRGREAIRRLQHSCTDCRRWKSRPVVPKMADLPAARQRLCKPVFYSTGTDCFGPFQVKLGRRLEKRWGIIFKCLTTRAVHLDILNNLSTDSFLMAFRRFIARRGTPSEIFSDQGTNFRGGERELHEAFKDLSPDLQAQLAGQKVSFHFNPPASPHFGGIWEREIRSVKTALYTTVGAQPVAEEVLRTVFIEVEGILNSKPLGYVSSDVTDLDPVTPNLLLMGRLDGSLPQVVYPESEILCKRQWRHSQVLSDHFWSSYIRHYLPSLQVRQKWHTSPADLKENVVVMLVDPQLPRALWPIGRVLKVHTSADGHVRSAEVEIKGKTVWPTDYVTQEGGQLCSEERCEELWDKVEGVRHKLTRILNPAKLTPYLRQCKAIDEQDEDEVLNSTQYPLRISKAGRLIDILHGRGQRGLQAFMESLEFYHPEQYTQLTGKQPTHRCSIILDEEGPEGLTQFLLLEVRKLREQLRGCQLCERRLSQRCRVAEEERSRAERKTQDLQRDRQQMERLRQDWEASSRELAWLKDRHLEQAGKYSRALEDQAKASARESELLREVEQLKTRLMELDKQIEISPVSTLPVNSNSLVPHCNNSCPAVPKKMEKLLQPINIKGTDDIKTQALLDIIQQDRNEATEQRHELCGTIAILQGELESSEAFSEKLESQVKQLQLKVRTLQLDWETEQKRSISYFNQMMELEKERDQALRSRDSLQLEYTDCLLDKNRLRKRIAELQANMEQQQRELEKERDRNREQSSSCLHCSELSLCCEDQCYGPCCSLALSTQPNITHQLPRQSPPVGPTNEHLDASLSNSEEDLLTPTVDSEKDVNRLSTFPFPPCVNSIHRRLTIEFDLDSWGSDENDNLTGVQNELSLSDSFSSLNSHLFPPDLVNLPTVLPHKPNSIMGLDLHPPSSSPPTKPKKARGSLADDITIIGGNCTGIFVSSVRAGSPAEQCGLKEGSELLELEKVLFGGGSVLLNQCTGEVAHFSLQWWTEPSSLKHRINTEAYTQLSAQLSFPTFSGVDSFYVRVNLDLNGDLPCLGVRCDDIVHVTDTRYNGKYQWQCALVNPDTAKPLQQGAMPNYNRAQQLLLVRLRTIALEQKDFKKKLFKKGAERVRLVKAVSSSCREIGSTPQVLYTLSNRHEENLIPYSMVQPIQVKTKRPVIFSPSLLSRGLIERLLQPAESGLDFNTCQPEPIQATERKDSDVFLLDTSTPEQLLGIRLHSIQDVISQDKHCLLELGLGSVERLLRQGVYPIIIHIRPKNKKHKLKKLLTGRGEDSVMEDVCQAEALLLETLPLLYHTLEPSTWSCSEELLVAIRQVIHSQQKVLLWVECDKLQ
ncbi:hypothetical protein DPEC_G00280470 [Dallia pectoralis]|uniref:Uncharacterized protein n=1 Tax=Dallia pectoralis TaxID=75939 RepID=A0ACC2FMZ2_DALPE|nr:hypothetical protein DPEC_G00280470 [Dallia pectoralis]